MKWLGLAIGVYALFVIVACVTVAVVVLHFVLKAW